MGQQADQPRPAGSIPTESVTVGQAGEVSVIAAIRRAAPSALNGDDAAVLNLATPNSRQVVSTDILVEGRHFRLDYSTAYEVGVKAVNQNFADIQAMGARPTALLLAIATPAGVALETISDLARGIHEGAAPWAAELVGGDVVRARDLVISLTAIGELAGPYGALTVDGARAGDCVIAHGPIGYSAAGLALLRHFGNRDNVPTDDVIVQELVSWHCAPRINVGRGLVARATGTHSMTDNSDGLVADLTTIAIRSGVQIDLSSDAITPDDKLCHAAAITGNDPWEWVLTGGEDHTFIGTTAARVPSGYRLIGKVAPIPGTPGTLSGTGGAVQDEPAPIHAPAPVLVDGKVPRYCQGWESL